MNILSNFGLRVKELRLRSGMSQEMLAIRSGLDRSYIGGVERGERNVSLQNIQKLTNALDVDTSYFFDDERFALHSAFLKSEYTKALSERFEYHIDFDHHVIAWQVKGVLSGAEVSKISLDLKLACTYLTKGHIKLLIDNRGMMANGQPFVFTSEVNEKSEELQRWMLPHCEKVAVLCNSKLMKNQLDRLAIRSGIHTISLHLYGKNPRQIVQEAYRFLDIPENKLISL